ncbi:MAG TPA: acyl carrier protein [Clostridiales bacterium]|jgi:acyl carrier protein|nr:acyl carrier protein [Clostridiales bacterium]
MIEKKINDILMEVAFMDEVLPNADLKDDLGIDSLRIIELIIALEDEFEITLLENDLNPDKIRVVKDLYDLISKYTED